jgi:Family of unknown function (DUF5681)
MTQPPHLPQSPDGPQPSGAAPTYTVGYGRPPAHSRVKPGQVLNPRGRPKGQRNVATVLRKTLTERTKVREGHRTRSVTKLDAIVLKLINDAGLGNAKAQANLFALMRAVGLTGPADEPTHQQPFTADDQAVIAEYLERNKVETGERSESDENPQTNDGTATGKGAKT